MMRRALLLSLALTMGAIGSTEPAWAVQPAGFDCGPDSGREHLTTAGFHLGFDAPVPFAPELATSRGVTGDGLTRQRSAHFFFRADFTPYRFGDLAVNLAWPDGNNDFDLYVLDTDGNVLASSDQSNIDGGTIGESTVVPEVAHCTDLSVEVRTWAARPDEPLTLDIRFQNPGPSFTCEANDPHPECAGKQAGDPPSSVPDDRTRLYFSGDGPGQLTMPQDYAGDTAGADPPMHGTLSAQRPSGGRSNQFTHTGEGFSNQQENPFQAHFSIGFSTPQIVTGDLTALLWVSSQTMQDGGQLYVDLYADGDGASAASQVARVIVPGSRIDTIATPIFVTFPNLNLPVDHQLVVQVESDPIATSAGAVGNPSDTQWTLYYDSVQFQSGVTLRHRDAPVTA
jgi:hypothetical protein